MSQNMFNKNRSCIEIGYQVHIYIHNLEFNKNRSCIEINLDGKGIYDVRV